jgi:hypothetical protein
MATPLVFEASGLVLEGIPGHSTATPITTTGEGEGGSAEHDVAEGRVRGQQPQPARVPTIIAATVARGICRRDCGWELDRSRARDVQRLELAQWQQCGQRTTTTTGASAAAIAGTARSQAKTPCQAEALERAEWRE